MDEVTDVRRVGPWQAVAVGVAAGVASGLFGVGGGVVIVPGLVMVAALDQRRAQGTSLTAIVPIALAGVVGYATGDEVDWPVAGFVAVGAVLGAPIGTSLLRRAPQQVLARGFAALLVLTAVRMVVGDVDGAGRDGIDAAAALGYATGGLGAGALAGLMGVGGGVVIVPLLTILFGFPLVLAKGTSLAVIVPTAIVGTVRNARHGTTDLRIGGLVGVGGVVTAWLAARVSLDLDPVLSAVLFAALLVLTAVRLARR